jgi:DNA polymerase-2
VNAVNFRGWLLDLYLNQQDGLTLWFISEPDDRRVCFTQAFPVAFYAAGPREESCVSALERQLKQNVFAADPVEVLRIDVDTPAHQVELFHQLEEEFGDLTWYDSDVTISTRYISRYGAFPLALCEGSAPTRRKHSKPFKCSTAAMGTGAPTTALR